MSQIVDKKNFSSSDPPMFGSSPLKGRLRTTTSAEVTILQACPLATESKSIFTELIRSSPVDKDQTMLIIALPAPSIWIGWNVKDLVFTASFVSEKMILPL